MGSKQVCAFLVVLAFSVNPALGQSSALDDLYGEAVHHYFAGDAMGAEQLLTRALELGSEDPRVYYFRGLARMVLGADAESDFAQGAKNEVSGRFGVNVGQALMRIQGSHRLQIEKARRDARLEAQQQREMMRRAVPMPPAPLGPVRTEPAELSDPFDNSSARSEQLDVVPTPVPTPSQPPAAGEQPAAGEPGAEPSPSDDPASDPFGDDASDPVPAPQTEPPTPAEVDPVDTTDPFGTDDPFGTGDPPASSDAPASSDSPSDDPFSN
jgi:hypothetical protein